MLAEIIKKEIGAKVRGIELSLLQRCGAHLASQTDIDESFMAGKAAVENAVAGLTDKMVGFERSYEGGAYVCRTERAFIDYALPLIQGETRMRKENGLPRFAKLKKVLAK